MDHEYDGIQELDNNLPPWWVWGFYMTIVFAVAYMFHYHFLKTGDLQIKAYEKEMVQAQKDVNDYLKSQAMNVDENNVTKLEDPAALATGKTLFTTNCTVCHKEGQGDIGPNLTDKFWLYGNDVKDVFLSVKNGRPNGMPEHTSKLNPIEMQQVVSYVLSMKYKAGREPQGKEYK
jgi:cytochrome c oxidase cbb3-type subunit 3